MGKYLETTADRQALYLDSRGRIRLPSEWLRAIGLKPGHKLIAYRRDATLGKFELVDVAVLSQELHAGYERAKKRAATKRSGNGPRRKRGGGARRRRHRAPP